MLLWVILAVMTAATVAAVLHPLRAAGGHPAASVGAPGLAVYRDQLAEVDADLDRGLISAAEASAARVEIQRRILRQADADDGPVPATTKPPISRWASLAIMGLVPGIAIASYALLGAPHLPDQPLSQRRAAAPERAQIAILVARVEEQLRANPADGRGWEVIAPVYARLGRDQDALEAWRQAIRLLGSSTPRLRGLVEASIAVGQGLIDGEARAALATLRDANPDDPISRFWLAVARHQDGQRAEAIADLKALLDGARADAPWRTVVEQQLVEFSAREPATAKSATVSAPGPTTEQVTAAGQLAPEDRARMITGMVDGLAARLARDSRDVDGWLRLVNAYQVLGRTQDAKEALGRARAAFAKDTTALARLAALAKDLGLGG